MPKRKTRIVCTSVFKNGGPMTKSRFTKAWAELVNRLEKAERTAPPKP